MVIKIKLMKTIKLIMTALVIVTMASCKKEEKPEPIVPIETDSIDDYRMDISIIDNAPIGNCNASYKIYRDGFQNMEHFDAVTLNFDNNDFYNQMDTTLAYSVADTCNMWFGFNTYTLIWGSGSFTYEDFYSINVYKNDTIKYSSTNSGQQIEYNFE